MDGDPLDRSIAHLTIIPHDSPDLLERDFLVLGLLDIGLDILGRIDELILVDEHQQSSLDCPPLHLLIFVLFVKLVEGLLVLLDLGDD